MDSEGDSADDLNVHLSWPDVDNSWPIIHDQSDEADANPETAAPRSDEGSPPDVGESPRLPPPSSPARSERWNPPSARAPRLPYDPPTTTSSDVARRIDELNQALTAMNQRLDTLTDATVTMRGLMSERVAEIGDAVSRYQTELSERLAEVIGGGREPLGEILGRPHGVSPEALAQALAQLRVETGQDVEEVIGRSQVQTARDLQQSFKRIKTDLLNELHEHRQSQDRSAAEQMESLSATEHASLRLDQLTSTLATDLAELGQRLGDDIGEGTEAGKIVTRAATERISRELTGLGTSVAAALEPVALQLERMAASTAEERDTVGAVADSLDELSARVATQGEAGAERQDALVAALDDLRTRAAKGAMSDVKAVRTGLSRVEGLMEAVLQATAEPSDAEATAARLERSVKSISDRVSRTTATAVQNMTEVVEGAMEQMRAVAPEDRPGIAALTRLEEQLVELSSQRAQHEHATEEALVGLGERVGQMAEAQADDFERMLDSVENASPAGADSGVAQQLAGLTEQVESLRRRLAVRARPPALDDAAIGALADAVAARLADNSSKPKPAKSAPSRSTRRSSPGRSPTRG